MRTTNRKPWRTEDLAEAERRFLADARDAEAYAETLRDAIAAMRKARVPTDQAESRLAAAIRDRDRFAAAARDIRRQIAGRERKRKAPAAAEEDLVARQLAAVRKYCGEAAYQEALRVEERRASPGGLGPAIGFDTYTAWELNDKPRVVEFPPDTRVKVGRGAEADVLRGRAETPDYERLYRNAWRGKTDEGEREENEKNRREEF